MPLDNAGDSAKSTTEKVSPEPAAISVPEINSALASISGKPNRPHGSYDPHATLDAGRMIKVALQHYQEGREQLAMQTLTETIQKFPNDAKGYAVRASFLLQADNIADALRDLEQAAKIAPDDAEVRVNRAQAYRAFGRELDAMKDLDHAVSVAPDLVSARFNRGVMFFAKNELDKALGDFEHCIAVDPHAAAPYYNRASVLKAMGKDAAAVADLEHFIQLSDNSEWKKTAQSLLDSWQATDAGKVDDSKDNNS